MVDLLEDRDRRNKLRSVVQTALRQNLVSKEEMGFVVALTEKFRLEIERKVKQAHMIQGEISQLQQNEQMIINLVENMIGAAARDKARQETLAKLKEGRENTKIRRAETKEKLKKEKEEKESK